MEKEVSSYCKKRVFFSSPCSAWSVPVAKPLTAVAVALADAAAARALLEVRRTRRPNRPMRLQDNTNSRCLLHLAAGAAAVVAADRGSPLAVPES